MLVGSASVDDLLHDLTTATIDAFSTDDVELGAVACLQVVAEMRKRSREALLPPSLHPTIPPAMSLQVWDVGASPWGAFTMVMCRVSCRSGVRARGFTTAAFVSTEAACGELRRQFGFPARVADVSLRRGYDRVTATVTFEGNVIAQVEAIDPEPMANDDVQYTGILNLAHTPNGARLVQVEPHHHATRVERLRAALTSFDGAAWGSALLEPAFVVSSSLALESVEIPAIRFVCKPDELAFTGTEAV